MPSLSPSQILVEMAHLTAGQLSLEEVLQRIAHFVLRVFPVKDASIFLYDYKAQTVTPAAIASTDEATMIFEENITLRLQDDSVFFKALREERAVYVAQEEDFRQDILSFDATQLFMFPLRSHSDVLGLLVLSSHDRVHPFDDKAWDLLQAVGNLAAVIINKAQMSHDMERSEEKYRTLTENASDIVFTLDASGRFTFLNSRIEDVLGYRAQDLVGTYFSGLVTPRSWESTVTRVREAMSQECRFLNYRWEAIKTDGTRVLLDVNASLLVVHGAYAGQQGIARDITENRRLARELAKRQRDLRASQRRQSEMQKYLALVTQVQEDERRRISRELHDDTVQALVALGRRLEMCRNILDESPSCVATRLDELIDLIDDTLTNLRRFCRELRPSVLDDLGLIPALEWLLAGLAEYGVDGAVTVHGSMQRLPSEIEVAVFRIVQEALNNVKQHAGRCKVEIDVEYAPESLTIEVHDDGIGFNRQEYETANSLGLIGMHERAALLEGSLEIRSAPGEGTLVTLRVPLSINA